eukprot:scaffold208641_cov15-Tisochrysis_lutea.AAC.1
MATQCCESCAREARLPQRDWAREEMHESSKGSVIDDLTPGTRRRRRRSRAPPRRGPRSHPAVASS